MGDKLSRCFFFLVLSCWYFVAMNKPSQAVVTDCYADRPQSLSSHAFCGSVSQSSASQKKTLHHGAHALVRSPLIPLLRPQQQLRRLETRGHRHTHRPSLNSITTSEDRSGSDGSGLSSVPPFDRTQCVKTPSPGKDHLSWTLNF